VAAGTVLLRDHGDRLRAAVAVRAIITLTTVGYGEVCPVTTGGRVFTGVILVLGPGIVAVPTGLLASAPSKLREMDGDG
jgi:voltage-gated potassium channel